MGKKNKKQIWLSWSSGKDSYATLRTLREQDDVLVQKLFTVIDGDQSRVPMHAVAQDLVLVQANALGLALDVVMLGEGGEGFVGLIADAKADGVDAFAFGDLFLEDIRAYREEKMVGSDIETVFPIWKKPTLNLVEQLIGEGMRAVITSVDLSKLPVSYLGQVLTLDLVREMASNGLDPCGEHGEYHSFVFDGPLFQTPVLFERGEPIVGDDFAHLPLLAK